MGISSSHPTLNQVLIYGQDLDSPDEWRRRIKETNDGSMPREPYQRCSQAVFEAWLKPRIQENPLIESHFGWKFETLTEYDGYVESKLVDQDGHTHIVKSQYVIGCDGAGSSVRRAVGIEMKGDPALVNSSPPYQDGDRSSQCQTHRNVAHPLQIPRSRTPPKPRPILAYILHDGPYPYCAG